MQANFFTPMVISLQPWALWNLGIVAFMMLLILPSSAWATAVSLRRWL